MQKEVATSYSHFPLQKVLNQYNVYSVKDFVDNEEVQRLYFIEILKHIPFVSFREDFVDEFLKTGKFKHSKSFCILRKQAGKFQPYFLNEQQFLSIYNQFSAIVVHLSNLLADSRIDNSLLEERLFMKKSFAPDNEIRINNLNLLRSINDPEILKQYFYKDKIEEFHSLRFAIIPWINNEYRGYATKRTNNDISDREKEIISRICLEMDNQQQQEEYIKELSSCLLWTIYEQFIKKEHYEHIIAKGDTGILSNKYSVLMDHHMQVHWDEILLDTIHFATLDYFSNYFDSITKLINSLTLNNKSFDFIHYFLAFEKQYQKNQFNIQQRSPNLTLRSTNPFHFLFRDLLSLTKEDLISSKSLDLIHFFSTFSILFKNTRMYFLYEGRYIYNGYIIIYDYQDKEEQPYSVIQLKGNFHRFDYDHKKFLLGFLHQLKSLLNLDTMVTGKQGIVLTDEDEVEIDTSNKNTFQAAFLTQHQGIEELYIEDRELPLKMIELSIDDLMESSSLDNKMDLYFFPWAKTKHTGKDTYSLEKKAN